MEFEVDQDASLGEAKDADSERLLTDEGDRVSNVALVFKKLQKHIREMSLRCKLVVGVFVGVALLVVVFMMGLVIGAIAFTASGGEQPQHIDWGSVVNDDGQSVLVGDWLDGKISPDNIKENLKELTLMPHIAGSDHNKDLAVMILNLWKGYGFDDVQLVSYSVMLSYPDPSRPNALHIQDKNNRVTYRAHTSKEPPLIPSENDSNVVPPFNAYSGVGTATGNLVYVNYGRLQDFLYLQDSLGISVNGSVCIVRYGRVFRGDKAKLAQRYGCVALIIYSDPAEYAPRDGPPVYPDGASLPPGGVQRGFLYTKDGDAKTPGIPSLDGVFRYNYDQLVESGVLPGIPVQPISYGDALHFLELLDDVIAPDDWQGQLNLTYKIKQSSNEHTVYIEINNQQVERDIYNVIGTINGTVEPDKMVLLGNHRDAWVFGAVDPNSGTAVLIELARRLGDMIAMGWKPGRSIVLCSWDAEEYGMIGSVEWVEDHLELIKDNAVAYLNVDEAVSGLRHFGATSSPLLNHLIINTTKAVKCACSDHDTVYDQWKAANSSSDPQIRGLGSGTDYVSFIQFAGVSCSNLGYYGFYPVYHSVHDNFDWMSKFGDPEFIGHQAMGRVWGRMALAIATSPILPYSPSEYAVWLSGAYESFKTAHESALNSQGISLSLLETSVQEFNSSAQKLQDSLNILRNTKNPYIINRLNNKLLNIERAFIHAEGLPGRPYYKHVLFAPSSVDAYSSASFAGIVDSLFNATTPQDWEQVHQQLDIVAVHVRYATQIML